MYRTLLPKQILLSLLVYSLCRPLTAVPPGVPYEPVRIDPLEIPWTWVEVEAIEKGKDLRCLEIGADGRIWLGYHNNIASYDGQNLKVYPEINSKNVQSITAMPDGSVFLCFETALWRGGQGTWFRYQQPLKIPRSSELGVRQAPDGKLWIASGSELLLVEPERLRPMGTVAQHSISDFDIDLQGRFWIAESPSGTVRSLRYDSGNFVEERRWEGLVKPKPNSTPGSKHATTDILCDSNGNVWIANQYDSVPPKQLPPGSDIWTEHDLTLRHGTNQNGAISQTSDGIIRITGKGAIHRLDPDGWQVYIHPRHVMSSYWAHIKEGPDGSVWVMEKNYSVNHIDYKGENWRAFEGITYQTESPSGTKWFLGSDAKVISFNPNENAWTAYGSGDGIIDTPTFIYAQSRGRVWVTGSHDGIAAASVWDGSAWKMRKFPDLGSLIVERTAAEDNEGNLLLAGKRTNPFGDPVMGQPAVLVSPEGETHFLKIADTKLFSAKTHKDGRIVLNGIHINTIENNKSERLIGKKGKTLKFRFIHRLEIAENGDLWVANWRQGVARYRDGQWTYYHGDESLGDAFVADLKILQDNRVAALTSEGLFRFDGNDWHCLPLPGFGGVSINATLSQSQDGAIWISVEDTFSGPGNRSRKTLRYVPDTIPPETSATLQPNPERYSRFRWIEWSGQNAGPEASTRLLQFSHRIDDDPWSAYSENKTAYLQNLKPGTRQVEVRARDMHGNVDPTPAVLEFEIHLPFWETGWFVGLLVAVAIAIAALIYGLLFQRYLHVAALDRMRMRFLSNISHELRTPLTLIAGPLEALAARSPKGSESEKDTAMALRNTHRLSELVEQLLELRNIEAEPSSGTLEACEIVAFVSMIVSDFDKLGQTANQRVTLDSRIESSWFMIDKDAYRKILDNLIMNALKYSEQGSTTRISISEEAGTSNETRTIRIVVADEGKGIQKDSLPHIFEPFYTGKTSSLPGLRSFGIGLALVKELVELHHGTVTVESPTLLSTGKQGGARFTVSFPNVHVASPGLDAAKTDPQSNPRKAETDRPLILVVEDQQEIREFLQKELNGRFEVIEANNGQEALTVAQETIPDLILADVMMPGLTGIELCQQLRDTESTSHIPVILQTASTDEKTRRDGIASGAIDFVGKPFSLATLTNKIENLLNTRTQFAKRLKVRLLSSFAGENGDEIDVFITRIQSILNKNLSNPQFNANDFAAALGMSSRSCHRKFAATLDTSPGEFIKSYRLEKSVSLLESGSTASEIAEAIAYSDLRAYTRAFKKRFGCTPAVYKKKTSPNNP